MTEKTGIPRVREALEANDWAQPDEPMLSELETASEATTQDHDTDVDADNLEFGFDRADMEGLRRAIWGFGDDDSSSRNASPAGDSRSTNSAPERQTDDQLTEDDVAKVEGMMRRLQAARDTGQGMGEAERKRFAARAVQEVMKDL